METGRAPINRKRSVTQRVKRMLGLRRRSSFGVNFRMYQLNKQLLMQQTARAAELLTLWRGAVAVIDEVRSPSLSARAISPARCPRLRDLPAQTSPLPS